MHDCDDDDTTAAAAAAAAIDDRVGVIRRLISLSAQSPLRAFLKKRVEVWNTPKKKQLLTKP